MTALPPNLAARIWQKDAALWPPGEDDTAQRLGWLDCADWMLARADELQQWARKIVRGGKYDRVIWLGMGGASLAVQAFAECQKPGKDGLRVTVIDTTHPHDIQLRMTNGYGSDLPQLDGVKGDPGKLMRLIERHSAFTDITRCLFVVASKSGRTAETVALYHYFHARVGERMVRPHRNFVVITDEGVALPPPPGATDAPECIFYNRTDIGGRFSALSYFGMVGAALMGFNIKRALRAVQRQAKGMHGNAPEENAALHQGFLLDKGMLVGGGRRMFMGFCAENPPLARWLEQLIAESLGKDGNGVLPLVRPRDQFPHPTPMGEVHPEDLAYELIEEVPDNDLVWKVHDFESVAAFMLHWQFAVAVAAADYVNPFDQPDVEATKKRAQQYIGAPLQLHEARLGNEFYSVEVADAALAAHSVQEVLARFAARLPAPNYLAILCYAEVGNDAEWLSNSRIKELGDSCMIFPMLGYGPQYLHSTGQLFKGGLRGGNFIQVLGARRYARPNFEEDIAIPGRDYSFGDLHLAQADADFAVLAERGGAESVLRVHFEPMQEGDASYNELIADLSYHCRRARIAS